MRRKYNSKKLNVRKSKDVIVNKNSVIGESKKMDKKHMEIKETPNSNEDNMKQTQSDDFPNLNWLVNLSAASIIPNKTTENFEERKVNSRAIPLYCKPGLTYTELIEKALVENGELTVSAIYEWISNKYPYFKIDDGRWKNSVRHNLSINPQFRKGKRAPQGCGHYWTLNKEQDENFHKWKATTIPYIEQTFSHKDIDQEMQNELEIATRSILEPESINNEHLNSIMLQNVETDDDLLNHEMVEIDTKHNIIDCSDNLLNVDEINEPDLYRTASDILNGIVHEVRVEQIIEESQNDSNLELSDFDLVDSSVLLDLNYMQSLSLISATL